MKNSLIQRKRLNYI